MPVAPIVAAAPHGINDAALGAPVDVHFRPLQGAIGRSLFPGAKVWQMRYSYVAHDATTVRDSLSLEANLSAWSIVDASLSHGSDNRFGTYRAFQVVGISSIDDTSDMEDPPPEAAFYVAKILWGYSYEAVFEGQRHSFTAGVGAHLATYGGDVNTFAQSHGLKVHFVAAGLQPRTPSALFARDDRTIVTSYSTAGPPSPIFVEYRALPSSVFPRNEEIPFESSFDATIHFLSMHVDEDGSWGSTPWNIEVRCFVGGAADNPLPVTLLSGTRVDGGGTYSLNQTIELSVTPGDSLECTANGSYADMVAHDNLALGRSSPVQIVGPGRIPIAVSGSGGTSYSISAEIEIRQ